MAGACVPRQTSGLNQSGGLRSNFIGETKFAGQRQSKDRRERLAENDLWKTGCRGERVANQARRVAAKGRRWKTGIYAPRFIQKSGISRWKKYNLILGGILLCYGFKRVFLNLKVFSGNILLANILNTWKERREKRKYSNTHAEKYILHLNKCYLYQVTFRSK